MRKTFYKFIMLLFSLSFYLSLLFASLSINLAIAYTTEPPSTAPIGINTTPPPSATTTPTPATKDANISVDVQSSITRNPNLSGLGITVTTINGVVTLNGNVNNQAQADLAIRLAQSVTGVKDVQSKLVVKE